ncbi:MAG: B12-binding domain-containing radical SAM protein [Victivallaceae bacterium]
MKHEILFLEVNSSYSHSMLSYGLLKAFTGKMLPEWRWRHLEATLKSPEPVLLEQISACSPDVIAATGYLFNIEYLCSILKQYSQRMPGTMIFLGGPEFLGRNDRFLMNNHFINGVFRGDESSFYLLLKNLHHHAEWKDIPGLCYLREDVYFDNGTAVYSGTLDELPSPYVAGDIHEGKPFYQIETSRGCVGECTFCTSALSARVAYHSAARVKADIECIRQHDIREIRLIDRTFNDNPKRAIELLEIFYSCFPDMRFHLEINPAMLTEPLLTCLKQALPGMLHIEAGIQTLNADSLKAVRRPAVRSKSIAGLKQLVECANFAVHADLIAGLPGQSLSDVFSDVENLIDIGPQEIQLEKLKFLPGTVIRDNPPPGTVFNENPPYEVICTAEINQADFIAVKQLSIILDGWYNSPQLNSPFVLGHRRISNFCHDFIAFLQQENFFAGQGKDALDRRFALLEKFVMDDALLSQQLLFCRLSVGLPVPLKSVSMIKSESVNPEADGLRLLWRKTVAPEYRIGKYLQTEFDFNIGDLWLNPRTEIKPGRKTYLFGLYYGRNPSEIYEVS